MHTRHPAEHEKKNGLACKQRYHRLVRCVCTEAVGGDPEAALACLEPADTYGYNPDPQVRDKLKLTIRDSARGGTITWPKPSFDVRQERAGPK